MFAKISKVGCVLLWAGLTTTSLISCIHLKLGETSVSKANDTEYQEPTPPFRVFKDSEADKSWQSDRTGNVIALFTDCSKKTDRSLNQDIQELSKGFDRLEGSEQKIIFYNNREAIQFFSRGFIDGIKVSMESVVFNKNQCFYRLTYSGVSNQFEKEKDWFEKFKKEFKAP